MSSAPVAEAAAASATATAVRGSIPRNVPATKTGSGTPVVAITRLVRAKGEFGGSRRSVTTSRVRHGPRPTSASRIARAFGFASMSSSTRSFETRRATWYPRRPPPVKPTRAAGRPAATPNTQPPRIDCA